MAAKILVLGATGHVGVPLVEALLSKGESVRAASRAGRPVAGAEGVVFDFADPAGHAAAFDGVDRVYLMMPTGFVDVKTPLLATVKLAAERGVKIVFQSVFGVEADDSIPYRQVEIAIEKSGVPYVILRPNWFADNFHIFWKAGIEQGVISLPAGQGKSSFIDVRDIAESAAVALTTDRFDGQAFSLTGPEALGYGEAAALIAEAIGQPVRYQPSDDASFIAMLEGAGVPSDYARFLASILYPVREGWTAAVTDSVTRLTGHKPRSLETYVRDNLDKLKS